MPKTKKIPTSSIELLPPVQPPVPDAQMGELLKKLVREQVAEILAQREAFTPWFRSKRVSDEIRRLQTVPEHRKWRVYFERFGCLLCHRKRVDFSCNGMCHRCHNRVHLRLESITRELMNTPAPGPPVTDQEQVARQVLDSLLKGLPAVGETRLLLERGEKPESNE